MKIAKLTPLLLLPIHFLVYLVAANFGLLSFNFDAIFLGGFFGIVFWWILVYPICNILGSGGKMVFFLSILIPLVIFLAAHAIFSFNIASGVTVISGSKVYVENGVFTTNYAKEVVGQIAASVVGVLIGIPFFLNFLNYRKKSKK